MKTITENSTISIALLITVIVATLALGRVLFQGEVNAKDIIEVKQKQSTIDLIQMDIAVIKTKVENIEKSLPKKGQ
jgi:hypothetical protein